MNFFSPQKATPRVRRTLGCVSIVSAVGVAYIIYHGTADDSVDTRPILPTLLAAHPIATPSESSATPLAEPREARPAAVPAQQANVPSAVLAALALPMETREDAATNAIREWAMREPERALVFARSLRTPDRSAAIQTVLETLGDHPALALKAGREILLAEPEEAEVFGSTLINALTSAKEFTTALELAKSSGIENSRIDWTSTIVGEWVRSQPEMVPQLAAIIARPGTPEQVIQSFRDAWASAAPASAAESALALPPGEVRQGVVARAVSEWISQEPKAAAEWIDQNLKSGPEFDQALAALLTQTPRDFYSPQAALERTTSISDPQLRADTRATLMRSWAETDRQAALNYLQLAKEVGPEERGQLFVALTQPPASPDTGEPQRIR